MKKVGFRRKMNIDWSDPFMVFFAVFTLIGLFMALLVTIFSAWKEMWLVPAMFGGVGILFGIIGFIIALIDS